MMKDELVHLLHSSSIYNQTVVDFVMKTTIDK